MYLAGVSPGMATQTKYKGYMTFVVAFQKKSPPSCPYYGAPLPYVPQCPIGGCDAVPPPGRGQAPVLPPLSCPSSPIRNPIIRSDQHPVYCELPYLGCPPRGRIGARFGAEPPTEGLHTSFPDAWGHPTVGHSNAHLLKTSRV